MIERIRGSYVLVGMEWNDPDCRLNTIGYRIGLRVSELLAWRNEGSSKAPKREIRLRDTLLFVHTQVWKAVFGKPADAVEKSVEKDDECACYFRFILFYFIF